ncbi:MAG: hypothetical protein AB7G28_22960 [Pirellulales bacterium]
MAIAFSDPATSGPFHRTTLWHRTAPRELFKAWFSGDDERRWNVWKKHLVRRKRPAPLDFLQGKQPPILWGWPAAWRRDEILAATSGLARSNAVHAASRATQIDLPQAIQTVAAAYALPALAQELSADTWWSLAETMYRLAIDVQQLHVEATQPPEDVLRQQLLAGELPLVLGYLFPELQPMRSLRQSARQALSEGIIAVTDGEGLPHARLLPVVGPLAACWTRCESIGQRLERGARSREAENQYLWLLRRLLRLLDGNCRLPLAEEAAEETPDLRPIVAEALRLVGDKGDAAAASGSLGKAIVPSRLKHERAKQPDASLESAWAGLAVLAADWSPTSPRVNVAFADDPLRLELSVAGRTMLSGLWTSETLCDGQVVRPTGDWQELCWQSDRKCDFLELGIELGENLQLERQIVFSKRDRVLLVADVVSVKDRTEHKLRHSFSLPLARRVAWIPETETRDGVLLVDKQRTAVLPLGLYEWRCDPRGGTLVCENGRLVLADATAGKSLYCGLMLDLDPARSKKCRTWRRLTVSESLQVVPRDAAVGFRAQSGDDQWLVYRSLGPAANRAVLGQNISSEFYAGRFQIEDGLVQEWIEIVAEAE